MSRRLSRRRRLIRATVRTEPPPDRPQQMLASAAQALAVWLAQQVAQGVLAVILRVVRGH